MPVKSSPFGGLIALASNVPATSLAGNRRITREFCVRQTGSAQKELVGPDCEWREKIVAAGRAGEIILVHTIAAYADCPDKNTVAVKRKRTRENGDPVGESGVERRRGIEPDFSGITMVAQQAGKSFLLPVERAL
jgi:hypothetical protein